MTRTLAIHSHGGGSGKSNFAVNLATMLACRGHDVCLVDTDVQAPGLHVLLGVDEATFTCTLSDYLLGRCEIETAVYDATDRLGPAVHGKLTLVPSTLDAELIARIVGGGYDAGLLDEALRTLVDRLSPDVLILDTQAGMTNETMVALAAADAVLLMIRADEQDYRGAAVATSVAHMLSCPRTAVVVSMTASDGDAEHVRELAEAAYGAPVAAVIPYLPELGELSGGQILVLKHPDHPLVTRFSSLPHSR
jgi:MinD-like ATPase involved in chromosome partitioning or flagellar assembly